MNAREQNRAHAIVRRMVEKHEMESGMDNQAITGNTVNVSAIGDITPHQEPAAMNTESRWVNQLAETTDAERAITDAMYAVEAMPADVRLTEAVVLLQQARAKVAEFANARFPLRGSAADAGSGQV